MEIGVTAVHTQVIKNGGLTIFTDKEKVGNFRAYSRTKWGTDKATL